MLNNIAVVTALLSVSVPATANAELMENKEISSKRLVSIIEGVEVASSDMGLFFVTGIANGISWSNTAIEQDGGQKIYCPPSNLGITGRQYASLFVEYAKVHPEMDAYPSGLVMLFTLKDAFPCN